MAGSRFLPVGVDVLVRGHGDAEGVGEMGCFGTSSSLVPFLVQGGGGSGNGLVGRSCASPSRSVRRSGRAVLKPG